MVLEHTVKMAGHHRSGEQERGTGQGAAAWGRGDEKNEFGQAFYSAARNSAAQNSWADRNSGVDRNSIVDRSWAGRKYKNAGGLMCSHCGEIRHSK